MERSVAIINLTLIDDVWMILHDQLNTTVCVCVGGGGGGGGGTIQGNTVHVHMTLTSSIPSRLHVGKG